LRRSFATNTEYNRENCYQRMQYKIKLPQMGFNIYNRVKYNRFDLELFFRKYNIEGGRLETRTYECSSTIWKINVLTVFFIRFLYYLDYYSKWLLSVTRIVIIHV